MYDPMGRCRYKTLSWEREKNGGDGRSRRVQADGKGVNRVKESDRLRFKASVLPSELRKHHFQSAYMCPTLHSALYVHYLI